MLLLWDLYWPALIAALIAGVVAGAMAYRRSTGGKRTLLWVGAGVAAALVAAGLWHGPFGAADRFRAYVESTARTTLDYYEMPAVEANLAAAPTSRTLVLSGPADDFQRSELVRIMGEIPGVGSVHWQDREAAGLALPLLAEAALAALVAFGLGLLLSYLVEMRRRARAEWRW